MKKLILSGILGLSLTSGVFASSESNQGYFEVGSDTTTELNMSPLERPYFDSTEVGIEIDETAIILDKLTVLGQKIWKLIESGKPVGNFSTQRADIVPQGVNNWQTLSNWQIPVSKRYERVIKNKFGANVVTLRYRVLYNWGGTLNGKGAYLMGITVYPEIIEVAWGWNLDATVTIPSISNAGTTTNPVAAAEILVSSKVNTPLTLLDQTESYYIRGDGLFIDLQK